MQEVARLNRLYLKYGHSCVFDLIAEGHDEDFINEIFEFRYYPYPIVDGSYDESKEEKLVSWRVRQSEYKKRVWKLTEQNDLSVLEHFEKRGFKDYHLDHKVSIYYGFKNGIPEEYIAHISNLRMIPYKDNTDKGVDCFWDKKNLWIRNKSN